MLLRAVHLKELRNTQDFLDKKRTNTTEKRDTPKTSSRLVKCALDPNANGKPDRVLEPSSTESQHQP
jgi:hypothetical protein